MKKLICLICLILVITASISAQQKDFPELTGPYLGQKPPGTKPEIFANSIATGEYDNCGFVFSRNMDEVSFFSIGKNGKSILRCSKLSNGHWSEPEIILQSNSENNIHPYFNSDGTKLLFGSDRRVLQNKKVPYFNLWMSEKLNDIWKEPKPLPSIINTGFENCGSFSDDGTLFFRRVSQKTRGDLFQSKYINGEFSVPVKLPAGINTAYDESHPAISHDGSYLIFSSKRPGGFNKGKDELWISFKDKSGKWGKAVNMGGEINNGCNTSCATISPDGKYIFFVRIENGRGIPYWVSANIVNEDWNEIFRLLSIISGI